MKITAGNWKNKGAYFSSKTGHRIFFVEEGQGKELIFLHGFPTSSWDWSWIWKAVTRNYKALAPDFLGYGYSDKPKKFKYSIPVQADIVEELAAYKHIKKASIVAHNFGDSVAQELLMRFNNQALSFEIEKVVFMNGGLFMEHSSPRPIQKVLLGPLGFVVSKFLSFYRFKKSFSEVFAEKYRPNEYELAEFWSIIKYKKGHRLAHILIQYIKERYKNSEKWTQALVHTKVPLKLLIGAQDPVSGVPIANHFSKISPGSEVVILEDTGHYPQTENPEKVFDELQRFLDEKLL